MIDKQERKGRRGFIVGFIYAIPSLIAAILGSSIGTYLLGTPRGGASNSWIDAGDVSDLEIGSPRRILFERIVTDGWEVHNEKSAAWVILDERRNVTAFSPLCTHLGCAYRWEPGKQEFSCPCHGSAFDPNGNVVKGPAVRPLDRYSTKLEGSRLLLGSLRNERGA